MVFMKQLFPAPLLLLFSLCLFACNSTKVEGSELTGKWIGTRTPSHVLVITQRGKMFVIEEDLESSSGEKLSHRQFIATYLGGTLFFKHPVTSLAMQITYLKGFDYLNFDGQTFKRSS